MVSSLIRYGRSLAPRWLLIAAGAFLLSMFFLIGNLYTSQVELRQNAEALPGGYGISFDRAGPHLGIVVG